MKNLLFSILMATAGTAYAASDRHSNTPYAGLETRDIASLSPDDIAALQSGEGWGLALPAELNGYPGPLHVLELKEPLQLTPEQIETIEKIYDGMRAEAIQTGRALVEAERQLDDAFSSNRIDTNLLETLVIAAEKERGRLRVIHLSRHLETVDHLSDEQIARYAKLRGYETSACDTVPEGHDPEMWRRHNGCN